MMLFEPLTPWTSGQRDAVAAVGDDLAAMDARELRGMRRGPMDGASLACEVAQIIASDKFLDGFIAWRKMPRATIPVAVVCAWRSCDPATANVALFGRGGHARVVPTLYRHLAELARTFGRTHAVAVVQVPILTEHRAAIRMARLIGGVEQELLASKGPHGQTYINTIWRLNDGIPDTEGTEDRGRRNRADAAADA